MKCEEERETEERNSPYQLYHTWPSHSDFMVAGLTHATLADGSNPIEILLSFLNLSVHIAEGLIGLNHRHLLPLWLGLAPPLHPIFFQLVPTQILRGFPFQRDLLTVYIHNLQISRRSGWVYKSTEQ